MYTGKEGYCDVTNANVLLWRSASSSCEQSSLGSFRNSLIYLQIEFDLSRGQPEITLLITSSGQPTIYIYNLHKARVWFMVLLDFNVDLGNDLNKWEGLGRSGWGDYVGRTAFLMQNFIVPDRPAAIPKRPLFKMFMATLNPLPSPEKKQKPMFTVSLTTENN